MKATIKIEKLASNGSKMTINAECDNVKELEEITEVCRGYLPRRKVFGLF